MRKKSLADEKVLVGQTENALIDHLIALNLFTHTYTEEKCCSLTFAENLKWRPNCNYSGSKQFFR